MNKKNIYLFIDDNVEGGEDKIQLLGGKGANLAEMIKMGIPVPPGLTITTDVCRYFMDHNQLPNNFKKELYAAISKIEDKMNKKFGDQKNPLLVSIRSGAKESMPGMMETVLNVGLTHKTVEGLSRESGDSRFAYDSYRRLITMYADVVMEKSNNMYNNKNDGIRHILEDYINQYKIDKNIINDSDLTALDLQKLCLKFKLIIKKNLGAEFPDNPHTQLWNTIKAVFKSWDGDRAKKYRRIEKISNRSGTAVNIQSMVFGNMKENSATGVAFTRSPSTGEKIFYGEWLGGAQGEDVVAGTRTPNPLNKESQNNQSKNLQSLEETYPNLYKKLVSIKNHLENYYKDMQDIEFTIENGELWMLQTRRGKRNGLAAIQIALDLKNEKIINENEAIQRVSHKHISEIMLPNIDRHQESKAMIIAKGLPAGPGGATGQIVFTSNDAQEWHNQGKKIVLIREETSPEDIHGMHSADGILTSRGGMTSHAALVARGWGKCCVVGCSDLKINHSQKTVIIGNKTYREGDWISINGSSGNIYGKKLPLVKHDINENPLFNKVMNLVKKHQKVGVRANADTEKDAIKARNLGAKGIGLCRTEHMFFNPQRILSMRKMILATDVQDRQDALNKLLPHQQKDFYGILKAMAPHPVTIRLLDPPLHEFLPQTQQQIKELAKDLKVTPIEIQQRIKDLHETNPMLGHRGCRLGITYPEITTMQSQAIFNACQQLIHEGLEPYPEIMIPLIGTPDEFINQREHILSVYKNMNYKIKYKIGTMIELPRACLVADQIAEHADFFSFGTNDLTQTTFGYSRDDVGGFMFDYINKSILSKDPFESIDQEGVGGLVKMAIKLGRNKNKNLKIGICGEHGGDPESIQFFKKIGLDYVSCSPFRVPIARLSSAHNYQ